MIIKDDDEIEKFCCICFSDLECNFVDLSDADASNLLTKDSVIINPCKIHYTCIDCFIKFVTDYSNHPINEDNSHVYCPFPFKECVSSGGTKNIFDHSFVIKVLNESQKEEFKRHAERYPFPGYTIVYCPCKYLSISGDFVICNAPVLVKHILIKESNIIR